MTAALPILDHANAADPCGRLPIVPFNPGPDPETALLRRVQALENEVSELSALFRRIQTIHHHESRTT